MKIKFLSIIVISLLVSLAVTLCLSTDNEATKYSSDDTTHASALSAVGGRVNYGFIIDQTNNKIYNVDSLPLKADRIIDGTLMKTFMRLEEISAHSIYQKNALSWNKIEKKVLSAREFSERENYSMVVDPNNFTWIIWSKGQKKDEVWRG